MDCSGCCAHSSAVNYATGHQQHDQWYEAGTDLVVVLSKQLQLDIQLYLHGVHVIYYLLTGQHVVVSVLVPVAWQRGGRRAELLLPGAGQLLKLPPEP